MIYCICTDLDFLAQTEGQTEEQTKGKMEVQTEGQTDGRRDERKEEQMHEWKGTDGRTDRNQRYSKTLLCRPKSVFFFLPRFVQTS